MSQEEVHKVLRDFAKAYVLETELIATEEACGRIVATDIIAKIDVPQFDRSTVDGYAIKSRESHGATESIPALFNLVGLIEMGHCVSGDIGVSETMYIPTGGMLPDSADGVVMIEDAETIDDQTIALMRSITPSENVIHKGDDICIGHPMLAANTKLSALDIGVLCAQGIEKVSVYCRPRVTIISTGDEIIEIDQKIELGQIYDINGHVLENLVVESGASVVERKIVHDDYDALYRAVDEATDESDIVLLSGGSSVGTRDFTYEVIKALPESHIYVEGIAIKPGKPTIIGSGKGCLVIGLPGHPVSSIMVYTAFVDYYIRKLQNQSEKKGDFIGTLTENIHSSPGKITYQMVTVEGQAGDYQVTPKYGKSGMISLLASAKAYIIIGAHQEGLEAGASVLGYYLK